MLGLEFSRADARAFCSDFQPSLLIHTLLPDWTKRLPADPLGFGAMRQQQAHTSGGSGGGGRERRGAEGQRTGAQGTEGNGEGPHATGRQRRPLTSGSGASQAALLRRILASPTVVDAAAGNDTKAALIAHAAMDATALAGGLSVPMLISKAL